MHTPNTVIKSGLDPSIKAAVIVLVLTTCVIYWQTGQHEFINLDDNTYITSNPHLIGGLIWKNICWAFSSLAMANWHPVTWLSHLIDIQLYGLTPRGHHLSNVVLHACNTVMLFYFLYRVTKSQWRSLFVAALFALHPVHVESVAWAAERKDVISTLLFWCTFLCYYHYTISLTRKAYLATICCFIVGLMAKPMLVTTPLVMLLIDFWPLNRLSKNSLVLLITEKIPLFFCSLLSSFITIIAQRSGGAVADLSELPLSLRYKNAILSLYNYPAKLLWPSKLAVMYPFPDSIELWHSALALSGLVIFTMFCFKQKKTAPYLITGWLWFVIMLLPVIGIIQVGSQSMADRYLYIPATGVFILITWGTSDLLAKIPEKKNLLALLAGVAVTACSILTWQQIGYWRNNFTLYHHSIDVTGNSFFLHNQLGSAYQAVDNKSKALYHYKESIRLNPRFKNSRNNLGVMLMRSGNLHEAEHEFRTASEIDPNYLFARNNLATVAMKNGNLQEAVRLFQDTLNQDQHNEYAHCTLGYIYEQQEKYAEAKQEYLKVLQINPNNEKALFALRNNLN